MAYLFNSKTILLLSVTCLLLLVGFGVLKLRPFGTCANSISCLGDLSGAYRFDETKGEFEGKEVSSPPNDTAQTVVLGDSTSSAPKHINIDLSNQVLFAMEGEQIIYQFPVSTGKWGLTPTGEFHVWIKLANTRMVGGDKKKGTYYNLPNVPYTMYFYNDEIPKTRGYGIHGAYWHNNFGNPMSHGCINMKPADAKILFDWASPTTLSGTTYATDTDPGTVIVIYGRAPGT